MRLVVRSGNDDNDDEEKLLLMQNKVTELNSHQRRRLSIRTNSSVSLLYVPFVGGWYFEAVDEYLMLLIATKTVIYSSSVLNLPVAEALPLAVLHFLCE